MLRDHIRSNVIGYIALFCFAIGGSAIAANDRKDASRNSVDSRAIETGAVKRKDLHADAVTSAKVLNGSLTAADVDLATVQARVAGGCSAGQAIGAIGAEGAVSCTTIEASGLAGGDLQGSYPNPTLAPAAVAGGSGGEIADNTITDEDISSQSAVSFGGAIGPSTQLSAVGLRGVGDPRFRSSYVVDFGGLRVSGGDQGSPAEASYSAFGVDVDVGDAQASYHELITLSELPDPGPPAANKVAIYARDQAGRTQLVAKFADGTIIVLGEEAP